MRDLRSLILASALSILASQPAVASFHLMQIEQVIGGVGGDVGAQAIQLRMRAPVENFVHFARIRAWDATNANPVLIVDMGSDVAIGATGARVLIATPGLQSYLATALPPDFTMTNPIPPTYLPAGRLTFESDGGIVYWALAWGGAAYTGTNFGDITNDADGNFNPPFGSALPTNSDIAVRFTGPATAPSTNNAANYALTTGPAVFTNNAGASNTVRFTTGVGDLPASGVSLALPAPNPVTDRLTYSFTLPHETRVLVQVLDLRGRLVSRLVDRSLSAGQHALTWQVAGSGRSTPASGMYFLQLDAAGVRQSRKFLLIQ